MSRAPGDPPPKRRPTPDPTDPTREPNVFRPNPNRSPRPGDPISEPDTGAPPRRPKSKKPARAAAGVDPESTSRKLGTGEAPGWWERILYGRVGAGQLAVFCRQFAAYLDAGVDFQKTLSSLQRQFDRTALGPVIGRIQTAVRRGSTLTEAARAEPQAFDPMFVSLIRVAEERGGVPETLRDLGEHYEARQRLVRQARSAMIYPIAVLTIAIAVVAFLTIVLLPMFATMLRELGGRGAELPLPSRVLMALAAFVQSVGWFVLPLVLVGTPFALLRWYKTDSGKKILDRVLIRFPVFGSLLRKVDTCRLARTLSALTASGIDMASALDLTADVLHLDPLRTAVRDARASVLEGNALSASLEETRWFGHDVIAVIDSGEETGKLPETLGHLADDYEEQVEHDVKNLGQLVQPLILIGLGGIVLFIILAVLLPYISMLTSLTNP